MARRRVLIGLFVFLLTIYMDMVHAEKSCHIQHMPSKESERYRATICCEDPLHIDCDTVLTDECYCCKDDSRVKCIAGNFGTRCECQTADGITSEKTKPKITKCKKINGRKRKFSAFDCFWFMYGRRR